MDTANQIRQYVDAGDYEAAAKLSIEAAKDRRPESEVMQAILYLTAALRHNCMNRAVRKQDSGPEYCALEATLREVNKVTGEDMYGRIV